MKAVLGLGSNLGDREGHLRRAIEGLRRAVRVLRVSAVRETEPVGGPPQGRYLNAAVLVEFDGGPRDLLALAQRLEAEAGRSRGPRFGPRTLDVDLLLLEGGAVVDEPDLVVPHPRLAGRRFALEPLAEVAPDWAVPGAGGSAKELLEGLLHHP